VEYLTSDAPFQNELPAAMTANSSTDGAKSAWHRAAAFAAEAHAGQTRPKGSTPFIAHPARVALLVAMAFGCDDVETVAAAFLHDVLEKTPASLEDLHAQFGDRVASMVKDMSKDPSANNDDGYYALLQECDWQTRLVKLADALDHLEETQGTSADKIQKGARALHLAHGEEAPIVRARELLTIAVIACTARHEAAS